MVQNISVVVHADSPPESGHKQAVNFN